MNIDIQIIPRILRTDLRPWTIDYSEDKFRTQINSITKIEMASNDFYAFQFENAFNQKRKYFKILIDNALNHYFNITINRLNEARSDDQRKYILYTTLNTDVIPLIRETAKVIQETGFKLATYDENPKDTIPIVDLNGDNGFILHYLKFKLIAIYLEVQDGNKIYLKEDPLTMDDILMLYFNHTSKNIEYIKPIKIDVLKPDFTLTAERKEIPKEPDFIPIKADFRDYTKGILSYGIVVRNPDRFAAFEDKLFTNGYIGLDYNFTDKHGLKNELAIIYHHLISKRYFNDRYFPGNKELSNLLIKKFLNYRYCVNLDKQFNTFNNNPNEIADFVEKHYWLSNLPSC